MSYKSSGILLASSIIMLSVFVLILQAIPAASADTIVLNRTQTTTSTVSSSQVTLSNFNVGTGSNRVLVVGVEANNNYVNSITFGGVQLTKAVSSFTNNDAEFWYLKNPSGTANIVATMSDRKSTRGTAYTLSSRIPSTP